VYAIPAPGSAFQISGHPAGGAFRAPVKAILDGRSDILEVPDGPTALELIRTHQVDCCLLDIPPPGNAREVLDRAKRLDPSVEVALVTAGCTRRPANEAMKLGAYDHLTKPFAVEELRGAVERASSAWRAASGGALPP
jgi:DNA-binding NtrC family response regulator